MISRQLTATITSKGQSTIPAEVRKRLGLSPRDQIVFLITKDGVQVKAGEHSLQSVRGAVPAKGVESIDGRSEIELAKEDALAAKYRPAQAK
jgi:AbrB family looped-hinge helix DNA binding protein